jgi:hypothetical protein
MASLPFVSSLLIRTPATRFLHANGKRFGEEPEQRDSFTLMRITWIENVLVQVMPENNGAFSHAGSTDTPFFA